MAQRNTKKTTKKGGNKEFKNQGFKMRGKLVKWDTFGKNNDNAWYVLEDEVTERKYTFKQFNIDDATENLLTDSEKLEVYFNICYNNFNNTLQLQLVSYEMHNAD